MFTNILQFILLFCRLKIIWEIKPKIFFNSLSHDPALRLYNTICIVQRNLVQFSKNTMTWQFYLYICARNFSLRGRSLPTSHLKWVDIWSLMLKIITNFFYWKAMTWSKYQVCGDIVENIYFQNYVSTYYLIFDWQTFIQFSQ